MILVLAAGCGQTHLASPGTPAGNCSPALSSPPPRLAPLTTSRCPCENQTGSSVPTRPGSGQGESRSRERPSSAGERFSYRRRRRASGQGFSRSAPGWRAGRDAGQLPGIVMEDARRVAQEPVPELRSLPVLSLRHAFWVGGRHDTGDGNAFPPPHNARTSGGPRPFRK